jgi:outer membrane receptor protein involved in Fe transport
VKKVGLFDVLSMDDVNRFSIFGNFMFHAGPFGYFYGDVTFQNVEDSDNNVLPYSPKIFASLIYGYDFENGFAVKSKIDFRSAAYTDIKNTQEVPSYFDLSLMFEYELYNNLRLTFELNNLISRKNYLWSGYQEKQLDFVLGVDYRW